jgi:helicase required for RNAi-mediated heterochromatin assembly 1
MDPMRKWIMVECRSSFFEASKHTLLALQHLMREPFPMSKYLVHVQKEVDPPAYIKHNPYVNLSSLVSMEESADYENVNVLEDWPTMSSHSLDNSQSKALKRMLTSELAIIQGPPGTGKTFVSVVALQIACDNLRKEDAPIIVTAQTNHALDQLLRHTSQFEPNHIRLGGRSKDKEIKRRTLFEVRSDLPQKKQPGSHKVQATIAMKKLTTQCQVLLAPLEVNKGPLGHKVLHSLGLITQSQAESLEMESQCTMGSSPSDSPGILMEQWLGRCLAPCDRPIGPEQFDWGFEEDDFEIEQLKELEAEAVAQDDVDIEALRGPVTQLSDNWKGTGMSLSNADIQDILRKTDDLTTIRVFNRGAIYNYFKREAKKLIVIEIRRIAKLYQEAVVQRKVGMWEEDVRVLSKARIIGCTTTGLAKYRALLCALRPRICVVEEAAETLEAPVTAACFPSLEHLILVGDHQQLRPHTQVRAFEDEPYFLNLSLFERLVWNDVAFDTLTRQRRMIPEIRQLLYPIYQDTLKDHKSVKDLDNRPPVEGMGGNNSFFFCHEWRESRDINMSAFNPMEAQMLVQFLDYLVLNGNDATKITVLTFYNGQRKEIIRRVRVHPNLREILPDIQVMTVDSYQGEENDIVLLSLVRSNHKHSIGFLSSENRACVALSRAKRGFYIFGNAELLACESGTWASVVEIMWRNKKVKVTTGQERRVGYHLPLECFNHGRKIWCEVPEDFELIKGGCDIKCEGSLPCGHRCPYPCKCTDVRTI